MYLIVSHKWRCHYADLEGVRRFGEFFLARIEKYAVE